MNALLRQYGTRIAKLPWPNPTVAQKALAPKDARSISAARRLLDAAATQAEPWAALPNALGLAFPGRKVVCYGPPSPEQPAWVITDVRGQLRPDAERIVGRERILSFRKYELEKRDPFANRPANFPTIYRSDDELEHCLSGILAPNGLDHQLRMACYEGNRFTAYVGVYRDRGDRADEVADHAKLFALGPAIRTWVADRAALGMVPFGEGQLVRLLHAVPAPTLLVRQGRVVFANSAASGCSAASRAGARVTPIDLGGRRFEVVTLKAATPPKLELPPTLQRVAAALANGASDKEVADQLGVSLRTARTYSHRVLERLGFASRRELMLCFARQ